MIFYKSEKNYLWFAYIFTFIETPGGLFHYGSRGDAVSAPLFSFGPGLSFTFYEIFILISILKALQTKTKESFVFKKEIQIFIIFIVVLYSYSMILGMSLDAHITNLRILLLYSLLYSVPRLLTNNHNYERFYYLLSTITFLVLFLQILLLSTGVDVIRLITGIEQTRIAERGIMLERPIFSPYLLIFVFVTSLFYLQNTISGINKLYLRIVILTSFLAILITATRGWIIAFGTVFLFVIFQNSRSFLKNIIGIFFGAVVFLGFILNSNILRNQLEFAFNRTSSMEELVEGDLTAGGTLDRLTERAPQIIRNFTENPVLGWGFSDVEGFKGDAHVGIPSLLALTGIIGFFIMLRFWYSYIYTVYKTSTNMLKQNPYKLSVGVLISGFIGLLIINSSSTMLFGYFRMGTEASKIFLISFYLLFTSHYIIEAKTKDIQIIKLKQHA